jgi:hypothetical protein
MKTLFVAVLAVLFVSGLSYAQGRKEASKTSVVSVSDPTFQRSQFHRDLVWNHF